MSLQYKKASEYTACSLSVIPVWHKKCTLSKWSPFQSAIADDGLLVQWFINEGKKGLAIVCGKVSQNLLVFDIDDPSLIADLEQKFDDAGLRNLFIDVPTVETPKGGRHYYIRLNGPVDGSEKLAMTADNKVRIETRGEGAYVQAPGSSIDSHSKEAVNGYVHLSGEWKNIPVVNGDIHQQIIAICKSFDHRPVRAEPVSAPGMVSSEPDGRPGADWASKHSWEDLLIPAGWTLDEVQGDKQMWLRPGKKRGETPSATVNFEDTDKLYVFSSNASPFNAGDCVTKFAAYAILHHNRDMKAAGRALAKLGYGKPAKAKPEPKPAPPPVISLAEARKSLDGLEDFFADKCTDTANAHRFVKEWSHMVRYSPAFGWAVYNGKHWELGEDGKVMEMAKKTAMRMRNDIELMNEDERPAFQKWAKQSQNSAKLQAMIGLAKSDPQLITDITEFDNDPLLLNCENGTLNLATGELQLHRPEDMCSRISPVAYNPDAKCPTWDAFCERTFGGGDLMHYMNRVGGYALSGLSEEQSFWVLKGQGSNGKSRWRATIFEVLGGSGRYSYAATTSAQTFISRDGKSIPNDLAALRGARMIIVGEMPKRQSLDDGLLKDWTDGTEPITARFLNREFFSFLPIGKLFFTANFSPEVKTTDRGFWRRPKVVPCTSTITEEERDINLPKKLAQEYPGILFRLICGFMVYHQTQSLHTPQEVVVETKVCKNDIDPIAEFIRTHCLLGPKQKEAVHIVYARYKQHLEDNGEKPRSSISLTKELKVLDVKSLPDTKNRNAQTYFGISLRNPYNTNLE